MGCINSIIEEYQLKKCNIENTSKFSFQGQTKLIKVVSVYDADTMNVVLDINGKKYIETLRMYGIDSAELHPKKINQDREDEIKIACKGRERLIELCLNKLVYVYCDGWDKYGRLLGTVYLDKKMVESVNELLIKENLAYEYDGKKKKHFSEWYKREN